MTRAPSELQKQILNVLAWGDKDEGEIRGALRIGGRRAGGFVNSLLALYQRGLIAGDEALGLYTITDKGREALAESVEP